MFHQARSVGLSLTGRMVGHLGRLSCRIQPDVDQIAGAVLSVVAQYG